MNIRIARQQELAEKVVIIDGVPGCGKTMLSAVVSSLEKVELLKYSYEIEHLCVLHQLGLLDEHTCAHMIRLQVDLITYNLMMSREVNFRVHDLSSAFNSVSPMKYVFRALRQGDTAVPKQISKESPITHLATHALLPFSAPLFRSLGDRLLFIKMHRHPLYMLKQNEWNMSALIGDPRHFTLYVEGGESIVPFYAAEWPDVFEAANPKERAIFYLQWLRRKEIEFQHNNPDMRAAEITFESFVNDPYPHLNKLCSALGTKQGRHTKRILKREKIPRRVLGAGRDVPIYRRVGWSPSRFASTEEELVDLMGYATSGVNRNAQEAIAWLCDDYAMTAAKLECGV